MDKGRTEHEHVARPPLLLTCRDAGRQMNVAKHDERLRNTNIISVVCPGNTSSVCGYPVSYNRSNSHSQRRISSICPFSELRCTSQCKQSGLLYVMSPTRAQYERIQIFIFHSLMSGSEIWQYKNSVNLHQTSRRHNPEENFYRSIRIAFNINVIM
jgi:hypothetical protein